MQQVIPKLNFNISQEFKCKYQNKAHHVCFSEKCQLNAFICRQQCNCSMVDHFQCRHFILKFLLKKISQKQNGIPQSRKKCLEVILKIYQQCIDKLSQDLQQILGQIKYGGLQQNQIKFMTLIDTQKYQEVDGNLVSKLEKQLGKLPQNYWNLFYKQEQVELIWERQKKTFQKLRKQLKLTAQRQEIGKLNSKITSQQLIIRQFLGSSFPKFTLLYRASENNFQVQKFHQKCDGKENLLIIALTQFDKIIGGFTPLTWSSVGGYLSDSSSKSFLFSITNKEKYNMIKTQNTIYCHKNYGPTFGGGHDFYICDKSNITQNTSYANFPHTFNNDKKYTNNQESYRGFIGATNNNKCKFIQWEVYEVKLI